MRSTRKLATITVIAVAALAPAAAPAAAKKAPEDSYPAVIDCGSGPVNVVSGADLWSPLVDVDSGKKYKPVAWDVSVGSFSVSETKKGEPKKHAVECSYDDGEAKGTVTVKKA
jgi:hypothetical protein